MKMKKVKRIAAMTGVVLLVSIYLVTLFAAFTASEHTQSFFLASAFCTIVIPIMIYIFLFVYRLVHKKEDEISVQELKKQNKVFEQKEERK